MTDLRRCARCLLPETYETIEFDEEGICNICRSAEHKQKAIDWGERRKQLNALIEKYRGKYDYDCIVPFSGGKDSTFQLWFLVTQCNLKPLVIRFNHGFMRSTIQGNVERTLKKLGCDYLDFTPNWKIVKRVMLEAFRRKTDFCWHCHCGIYSFPLRMAVKLNVPLVFWGEPIAEITSYYDYENDEIEHEDEKKFNMFRNLGISAEDMFGMINSTEHPVDRRDLLPYTYPAKKDLRSVGVHSVCLGSFIPWDYIKQTEIIQKELGWEADELEGVPREIHKSSEKIECFMQGPRDYIKFLKRGYSRPCQMCAFEIRNKRMTPDEGRKWLPEEGKRPPSLDILLGYMGISEEEFNETVGRTEVSPYHHDYSKTVDANKSWDFDQWYREDNRDQSSTPVESNSDEALPDDLSSSDMDESADSESK